MKKVSDIVTIEKKRKKEKKKKGTANYEIIRINHLPR